MANRYPLVLAADNTMQELQVGDAVAGLVIGTDVQAFDSATAKTNVAQLFTKNQRANYGNTDTVSTTSTYTFDGASKAQLNLITVTNAITITFGAPTNIVEGTMYFLAIKAGDTAARSFAWNAAYKWPSGAAPASGTTTNGAYDCYTFIGGASNTLYPFGPGYTTGA